MNDACKKRNRRAVKQRNVDKMIFPFMGDHILSSIGHTKRAARNEPSGNNPAIALIAVPLDEQQQGVAKAKQESQEQQAFGKNQYVHWGGEWFPHELMVYVYQMGRHGVGVFFHHGPTALSCSLPHSCTGVVRSHCISMDRSGSMRWCKTRDSMSGAYLGSSRSTEVVE